MRQFKSGATRNSDEDKLDYEAFLSPLVIQAFGEYMHKHRIQADGKMRPGDNWKRGIPRRELLKSAWRHFHDWWMEENGFESREGIEDALCGLLFNTMAYLHAEKMAQLHRDNNTEDIVPDSSHGSADNLL